MNRQYGALGGLAIALVVLNHASHFSLLVSPADGPGLGLLVFMQALGTFAVPVLLFISGAFLSYSASRLSLSFVGASIGRLLWPYVIWTALFHVLFADGDRSVAAFGRNLLVGYPYHFIPLLLFWYISSPVLARVARQHAALLIAVLALYQAALIGIRFPDIFGFARPLPSWTRALTPPVLFTPLSDWAIYLPLGLVLGLHEHRIGPHLRHLKWIALGTAGALFLLGLLDAFDRVDAQWARFAAPVPLMFVLPVVNHAVIPLRRQLERLGKESYGLYLSHFVVIALVTQFASRYLRGLVFLPAIVFPALCLVALVVPLQLMDAMAKTRPTRRVYRYLFGTTPPLHSLPRSGRLGLPGRLSHDRRQAEHPT